MPLWPAAVRWHGRPARGLEPPLKNRVATPAARNPGLHTGRHPLFARSLSDLPMNIVSSARAFIGVEGICLDRLLKQCSALRKPDFYVVQQISITIL